MLKFILSVALNRVSLVMGALVISCMAWEILLE
jgi:hypothetical protein